MYAKVFTQIFDSSIAANYEVRHVFEDLLKLADKDGIVDMTVEAIQRRTNVPIDKVRFGIEELMKPDEESRSRLHEGRRLVLIDKHRSWGWIIVNYDYYRNLQNEESRRAYNREAKRRQREREAKRSRRGGAAKTYPVGYERQYDQALKDGASEDKLNGIVEDSIKRS